MVRRNFADVDTATLQFKHGTTDPLENLNDCKHSLKDILIYFSRFRYQVIEATAISPMGEKIALSTNLTHPFQYHAIRIDYKKYQCFSRLRGFDKECYPTFTLAKEREEALNFIEDWDKMYPPREVERIMSKYSGDIFSEEVLNEFLEGNII